MLPRSLPVLGATLVLCACGHDADTTAATRALAEFQSALQRGDETACRQLLTLESAPVLAEMPWQQVRQKQPLRVLGAARGTNDFRVQVEDPNEGGRRSEFVVVREYGRFVVDLVATAGLHAEVVEAAGSREEFVPRELTPADEERIRQHQLARPRRD